MFQTADDRAFFYIDGGAIPFDAPCYVERAADRQLRELLARGELAYVLTASQMGKTSLIFRAQAELRGQGIPTAYIDLQGFGSGSDVTIDVWCRSFLNALAGQMAIDIDVTDWWAEHDGRTAIDRLLTFLGDVVCAQTGGRAAVFVDEIGTISALTFGDDFLRAVRSLYQSMGAREPRCRLAFVLIGTLAPDRLIRDQSLTRFNVGVPVPLGELTLDDADILTDGLPGRDPAILRRVFHWTNGHPYLTQHICRTIAQDDSRKWTDAAVDDLVSWLLLADQASELDVNLSYVRETMLNSPHREELLRLYGAVRRGRRVRFVEQSPVHRELRFCGLVRPDVGGHLAVANPVYSEVFNPKWVKANRPFRWWLAVPRYIWAVAAVMLVLIALLAAALLQARQSARLALTRRLTTESATMLTSQYDLALLLGVEAYHLSPSAETAAFLRYDLTANPYLVTFLRAHEDRVNAVAFAPDGARFASADETGRIVLWDTADLSPQTLVGLSPGGAMTLAFGPGGHLLASGGCADDTCGAGEVSVWDTATGRRLAGWPAHDNAVREVAFNADGRYLASIGGDSLIVRALPGGEPVWSYIMEEGRTPTRLAFSPTAPNLLLFGDDSGVLRIADPAAGVVLLEFIAHTDAASALAFSRDGQWLASGGRDGSLALWDSTTWEPVAAAAAHDGPVLDLEFDPAGRLFSTGGDRQIVQWATINPQNARMTAELTLPGQEATGWSLAVAGTPRGTTLITVADRALVVWAPGGDPARARRLWAHEGGALGLAFGPEGALTSSGEDGLVRLWDVDQGIPLGDPLPAHEGAARRVAWRPGSDDLATVGPDGRVLLWDMAARPPAAVELGRHEAIARALAFSPDGARLASADDLGRLMVWDLGTGAPVEGSPVAAHAREIFDVAYSPDGRLLATGSWDGTVRLWDAATLAPLGEPLPTGLRQVWDVTFSPDGALLGVAGEPETIVLIDVAERTMAGRLLTGQAPRVYGLAFSPDGALLASAGADATIALWDVAARQRVGRPLDAHEAAVFALAFSPDGRLLASADLDGYLFLTVMEHQNPVSPACAIAGRDLTPEERAQYVGTDAAGAACPAD